MSGIPSDLEELRRRIDEIDDRLHALVIERAEIIATVADAKRKNGDLAALQPDREAEIIRRLARRHRGAFPVAALVRIWREILSATVRLQNHFAVAVYAPAESPGLWDLARDHYGSMTPLSAMASASACVRAVAEGTVDVAILPVPADGEDAKLVKSALDALGK